MDTIEKHIKIKQLEALYSNVNTIVFFTIIVTTAIAVALMLAFPKVPILIWAFYMYALCILRWLSALYFMKEGYEKRGVSFWLRIFLLFSIAASIGTGYMVFYYFDPNNIVYTIFVFITYAGYLSSGILTNSVYMPAFFAYSFPLSFLAMGRLILTGEPAFYTLILVMMFYYLALIGFARKSQIAFKENVNWNLEKDSLVQELRKQKDTAEQAIKSKSRFFASASHDLRQPLHALGLFHDALRFRLEKAENIEIMDKISNSTQSLNELLHSMLDISKLDAAVIENSPRNVNLSHCLSFSSKEFLARTKEKNLNLIFDIDPKTNVFVDPLLFERVVRNLIDNAIKYTHEGSINVSAVEGENEVILTIKDTGIGIPEDQLDHVFSEFNQLDNPGRDKQKGLGLGLAIVRRLCKLMDIDLQLQSQLNEGTSFSLNLVSGMDAQSDDVNVKNERVSSKATILLVEDDEAVMEGMCVLLESYGYTLIKAFDAEQALKVLAPENPDIILADYRLPGEMDGLKLINSVRKKYGQATPAILITGETSPEKIQLADSAEVIVLHKPVHADLLQNSITEALAD